LEKARKLTVSKEETIQQQQQESVTPAPPEQQQQVTPSAASNTQKNALQPQQTEQSQVQAQPPLHTQARTQSPYTQTPYNTNSISYDVGGPLLLNHQDSMTDEQVRQEMDVAAVEGTRSFKAWINLPSGAEFVYNQRYIKGHDVQDWLFCKNISRRMRYRRENKRLVARLLQKEIDIKSHNKSRNYNKIGPQRTNTHSRSIAMQTSRQQPSLRRIHSYGRKIHDCCFNFCSCLFRIGLFLFVMVGHCNWIMSSLWL
jgi:hypothetical protein